MSGPYLSATINHVASESENAHGVAATIFTMSAVRLPREIVALALGICRVRKAAWNLKNFPQFSDHTTSELPALGHNSPGKGRAGHKNLQRPTTMRPSLSPTQAEREKVQLHQCSRLIAAATRYPSQKRKQWHVIGIQELRSNSREVSTCQ